MARPGLSKHPKFRRLVHLLKEPMPHVRGYLELLWEVGYEAGNPVIGDETDVALACEFPGEAGKVVEALMRCGGEGRAGFIERLENGQYQIHDLLGNAPDYVKRRAKRESERQQKDLRVICPVNDRHRPTNGATPAPAPAPAPSRTTGATR